MSKDFDLVFLGNFAIDKITRNSNTEVSLGGGTTYGALAAYYFNNNIKIGICSNVSKSFDKNLFSLFQKLPISLDGVNYNSNYTTQYEIQYRQNSRKLILKSKAKPIELADIPKAYMKTKCFVLVPIASEISVDLIDALRENSDSIFALDIQGIIRKFNSDGTLDYSPGKNIEERVIEIIRKCGGKLILKASENEANYVTGLKDIIKSTEKLAEINDSIILSTLGQKGSLIKKKNEKMIYIPAFKPEIIKDETGAGDCYTAIFSSDLIKNDVNRFNLKKAGYCASAAASFLIEKNGPHGFKAESEIEKRIKSKSFIRSSFHKKI